MKRASIIIATGILLAIAGFACTYLFAASSTHSITRSSSPELAWLRQEYCLDDEQYTRVCELYTNYHPKCVEMCREIDAQNAHLKALLSATNAVTPEIKQALEDQAQLRIKCEANMLNYFYQVSQAMPPDQGKRYLAWIQKATLVPAPMSAKNQTSTNQ